MLKSFTVATTVTGDKFRNFIFFLYDVIFGLSATSWNIHKIVIQPDKMVSINR